MYRVAACALALLISVLPVTAQEDQTIYVPEDDPAMLAAIAAARATLPEFWLHFSNPAEGESDFNLKIGVTEGGQVEHFWCDDIVGNWRGASCVLANEAEVLQTVGLGDRIQINPSAISDWMYIVDGKIRGARTLRAMLPHLTPAEAADYEQLLLD